MEDLNNMLNLSETTPEQSSVNINNSEKLEITPFEYQEGQKEYDAYLEQLERPDTVHPSVEEYGTQTIDHATLIKEDVGVFDYLGRQFDLISNNVFEIPSLQRRKASLGLEKLNNPDKWNDDKEIEMLELLIQEKELSQETFGITGTIETFPAHVAGAFSDMLIGIVDSAGMIAAGTAASTAVGIGVGSFIPFMGLGSVIGGGVGFSAGLTNSFVLSQTIDAYRQLKGMSAIDMAVMDDDEGNPLNLDADTISNLSEGVGMLAGLSDLALNHVVFGGNPFVKKFLMKAGLKSLVANESTRVLLASLGSLGKSIATGGGMAGIIELGRLSSEELAKTFDEDELNFSGAGGFLERIYNILSDETKYKEAKDRVLGAVSVGALTAGAMSTTLSAGGHVTGKAFNRIFDGPDNVEYSPVDVSNNPIKQSIDILEIREGFSNMSKALSTTKLSQLSPNEKQSYFKILAEKTGLKKIFLIKDGNQKASDVFDQAGLLKGMKDDIPTEVPIHEFLALTEEFPALLDEFRISPEGMKAQEANDYLGNLNKHFTKSEEILNKMNVGEELTTEEKTFIDAVTKVPEKITRKEKKEFDRIIKLEERTPEETQYLVDIADKKIRIKEEAFIRDTVNVDEFRNQDALTESLGKILNDKDLEKFQKADKAAREDIIEGVELGSRIEIERIAKESYDGHVDGQIEAQLKELETNASFEILDNFNDLKKLKQELGENYEEAVTGMVESHKEEGHPAYAIDPRSLSKAQQDKYLKSPKLKELKVFVEGGLHVEASANFLDAPSSNALLEILHKSVSKEKAKALIKKTRDTKLKQQLIDETPENIVAIENAYNDRIKNNRTKLKFILENDWSKYKNLFRKILTKKPKLDDVRYKSETVIGKTKVGELNSKRFDVSERRNTKRASDAIGKYDIETAVKHQVKSVEALELGRATRIAEARVQKALVRLKTFTDPKVIKTLKEAGEFVNIQGDVETSPNSPYLAVSEILDTFNLSRKYKNASEQGRFNNYMTEQVQLGKGEITIPKRLDDPRMRVEDLTVDSLLEIDRALGRLLFEAKRKNKLRNKFEKSDRLQTEETRAEVLREYVKEHPNYDESKSDSPPSFTETASSSVKTLISTAESIMTNIENIATKVDQERPSGLFHSMTIKILKGDDRRGRRSGDLGKKTDMQDFMIHFQKGVDQLGKKKFRHLENTRFDIPEFKDFSVLNNGKLTKGDLYMLMAYQGDHDGYNKVKNYRSKSGSIISNETMTKVLDKYLDSDDMRFIQNILLDTFKSYEDRTLKLEKRTTGQDVTFIKAKKIIHRGKEYPGGYFPHRHLDTSTSDKAQLFYEKTNKAAKDSVSSPLLGGEETSYYGKLRASESTEQGRLKERVGSTQPLDYNLSTYIGRVEEVIHDLNYREPVQEVLQLIKNKSNSESIENVVGPVMNRMLLNGVIEIAGKMSATDYNYFGPQSSLANNIFRALDSSFAVTTLAMNLQSLVIQPVSLGAAMVRMGKTAPKHLFNVAQKMLRNPHLLIEFKKLAEEINPSSKFASDNIDSSLKKNNSDIIPQKSLLLNNVYKNLPKHIDPAKRLVKGIQEVGMSGFPIIDGGLKSFVALATYEQFLAGDVSNYPMSRLKTMTPEQIQTEAYAYSRQVSRLSLTHSNPEDASPIQKFPITSHFTKFSTDPRQQLLTIISALTKVSGSVKKSKKAFKKGEYNESAYQAVNATSTLIGTVLATSLASAYIDSVRSYGDDETALDKFKEGEISATDLALEVLTYSALSIPSAFVENTPILSGMKYSFDSSEKSKGRYRDHRNVQFPIVKVFTDMTSTATMIRQLVSDEKDLRDLSASQIKATLSTAAIPLGGLPVNATFKFKRYLENDEEEDGELVQALKDDYEKVTEGLSDLIDKYLYDNDDIDLPVRQDLEKMSVRYRKKLIPEKSVPDSSIVVISEILSQGEWDKLDNDTGASGVFQFTESRWKELSDSHPELSLTENGRISKNTAQQEEAMDALLKDNADVLINEGLEVNDASLYGSHILTVDNYVKIFKAKKKTSKLSKIIGVKEVSKLSTKFRKMSVNQFLNDLKKGVDETYKSFDEDTKE